MAYGDPVSSCVKVSPLILRKFKVGLPPSKKIIYLLQGNPLKMMKNAFCSILKTLFQIFNFFFASRFSFTNIYDPEDSRGRRALHLHLFHRHLDINLALTAESSLLHIASSRTRSGNLGLQAQVTNC